MNEAIATPARADVAEMRAHTGVGTDAANGLRHSPFVPLLLLGLAVLGWTVFQSAQLVRDRHALDRVILAQGPQIAQARRLRTALSALASNTQKLADAGDSGAQLIVSQLKKHGITIHPAVPGAGSAP